MLAESVSTRLRKHGLKCKTVSISVRGNDLISFERQGKIAGPTFLSVNIAQKAMELFIENYWWDNPIRSLGVRGVEITAKHDINGSIRPLTIKWEDGRVFEVDRVLDVRQAPSLKGGGLGIRYTCRICNKKVYLFDDEGRWFVERK